jgi:hypothetical protein
MQVLRGQDVLLQLLQVRECLLHASLIRYDRVRKAAHPPASSQMQPMKRKLQQAVFPFSLMQLEAVPPPPPPTAPVSRLNAPHVMKMILVVKVSIYTFKALEALFACIL